MTSDNVMVPQAITRSADHRYTYEGIQYPGVTTILGMLDKSGPLMTWAAKETALAAIKLYDEIPRMLETAGEKGVVSLLSSRANWTRDEAANVGTEIHGLADLVVRGAPTPAMAENVRTRVLAYADWWKASGWRLRLSEAMIVKPGEPGWGGTFDLLAWDPDGHTVLADIKTGKGVYREAVLQLAAYGMANLVQNTDGRAYPMPVPDRYVILHVTLDGVREIELSIGTAERMAFLACLDLWHWAESMKGKRL